MKRFVHRVKFTEWTLFFTNWTIIVADLYVFTPIFLIPHEENGRILRINLITETRRNPKNFVQITYYFVQRREKRLAIREKCTIFAPTKPR